ncbi:MAG TPA: DUF1254 domain-containing protein [Rhizomicrobium sp.]|nr:DUF1254 domain-containing protein [Rhizomicrobium sp.]
MRRLALWIVAALAVAAVVHYVTLIQTPGFIMKRVMMKMGEANTIHHQGRVTANSRSVVRPSPDLLYSVCPFDLTNGALHVTAPVPPGTYWSVSIFDDKTNNFFVKNDKQAKGKVDLLLTTPYVDVKRPQGAAEVVAPTPKGVVLFRTLINDEKNFAAIDAVRRKANCTFIRSRAS